MPCASNRFPTSELLSVSDSTPVVNKDGLSSETDDTESSIICYIDKLRTKYPRNLFIAHLNVNSVRHTFYEMYDILNGNRFDIFGVSETKVDASFTDSQFFIPGFKIYRQDRDLKGRGGGICVYIRDSIWHRILRQHSGITKSIEYMSFEVCFRKSKRFLVYLYKSPKVSDNDTWMVLSQLCDQFVCESNMKFMKSSVNTYFRKGCENRDNKNKFYKTVKPFLSDKSSCDNDKIILQENDKIVSDLPEVAISLMHFMAPSLIIQLIIMMDLTVFL